MAGNPFEVQTLNPFQALLYGQQSYDSAQKSSLQNAQKGALQTLLAGDGTGANGQPDWTTAARTLAASGDVDGASKIATIGKALAPAAGTSDMQNFAASQANPAYAKYLADQEDAKGVKVNVNNSTENARDKAVGEVIGKDVIGNDIKNGAVAGGTLRTLSTLDNANKVGGDDISSGPFGKAVLSGKQALSELTGTDLSGLPESEVTQKVGFDLATKMIKAISARPTQMEFSKALENVPGLAMSKQGRTAMISILAQNARSDQDIGRLGMNKANWDNWQDVKDNYYNTHPLISPFTGKPFGASDIQMLTTAAPGGSAAPSTAPSGQPSPAAASSPIDAARAAIASGAPRDAVIQRLQQNGIDPSGL